MHTFYLKSPVPGNAKNPLGLDGGDIVKQNTGSRQLRIASG